MIAKIDYTPKPTPKLKLGESFILEALPYDLDFVLQKDAQVDYSVTSGNIYVERIDNRHFRIISTTVGQAKIQLDCEWVGTTVYVDTVSPPVPEKVDVTPANPVVIRSTTNLNPTVKLKATVSPADADQGITYKTSDDSIASVTSTGTVTAKKAGKATITCTAINGVNGISTIEVEDLKITSLTLSSTNISLVRTSTNLKPTTTLTATIAPSNAFVNITFASSNSNIATIDNNGLITAIAPGEANITCTDTISGRNATAKVIVSDKTVQNIELNPTSSVLTRTSTNPSPTVQINATAKPTDAVNTTLTYTSADTSIATVSSSGLITAKKAGTVDVSVKSGNVTSMYNVRINDSTVEDITGLPTTKAFELTKINRTITFQLSATIVPSNALGATLTYTTSNETVASISNTGLITARKAGTATISVKAGNVTRNISITVTEKKVTAIGNINKTYSLMRTSNTLNPTVQLSPSITPSDAYDQTLTYISSNTGVATVSASGLVTANTAGSATITIKNAHSNISVQTTINVEEKKVTGISGIPASSTLTRTSVSPNPTLKLNPTISPLDAVNKELSYTSSSTSIATVDSTGLIRAVANGKTTITVKNARSGVQVNCEITVNERLVEAIGNIPSSQSFTRTSVTPSPTLQLKPTITPGDALSKEIIYASSDSAIATVSSDGIITAKGDGTARITVSNPTSKVTATCTVSITQRLVTSIDNIPTSKSFILTSDAVTQTLQLNPEPKPSDALDKALFYASSDSYIATVNSSGLITTTGFGNATITVTNPKSGIKADCDVKVSEQLATSISCTPQSFSNTRIGQAFTINTSFVPANTYNKELVYTSSNTKVVTLIGSVATIVGYGSSTITVTNTRSGKSYNIPVVCTYVPVTGIKVIPSRFKVAPNKTLSLDVTLSPANHSITKVEYVSSEPDVATVSPEGVVTGHKRGVCYIDCNADNNVTQRLYVTVTNLDVALSSYEATLKALREAMHHCNETIAQVKTDKVQDDIDKVVKPQLDGLNKEVDEMTKALGDLEDTLPFLEDGILSQAERSIIKQNFSILQIEEQDVTSEYNKLKTNKYLLTGSLTNLNNAYTNYKNKFNRLETVVGLLITGEIDAPIDQSLANEYKTIISELKTLIGTYRSVATDCIDLIAKAMANEAENNANTHTNTQINIVNGEIKLQSTKITQIGDRVTKAETSISQNADRITLVSMKADQAENSAQIAISQIEILSDRITSTVQKDEFSSMLEQNATSIIMAFNNYSGQSYEFTQTSFDIKKDNFRSLSFRDGAMRIGKPNDYFMEIGSLGLKTHKYQNSQEHLFGVSVDVESIYPFMITRSYGADFVPMVIVSGSGLNSPDGGVTQIERGFNCYYPAKFYDKVIGNYASIDTVVTQELRQVVHNSKFRANMEVETTKALKPNIEAIGTVTVDVAHVVELPTAMQGAILDYVIQITNIGDSNVTVGSKDQNSFTLIGCGKVDYTIKGILPKKKQSRKKVATGGVWKQ